MQQPTPAQHPHTAPSLDAIKRIRKGRPISARTHLIGVDVLYVTPIDEHHSNANASHKIDEQPNMHPQHEEPTPLSDQNHRESLLDQPTANINSMIDAVSKSVEDAIRNILVNGSLSLPKRNPQRRRIENEEVELQKQVELSQDRSFILVHRSTHCSISELH